MRSQVQDRRALEGMYASVYICPRVAPCAISDIISELKMFVDGPENLI